MRKRRHYGKDVYGLSILQILTYGTMLCILLHKMHQETVQIDTLTIGAVALLFANITTSVNSIRGQWQVNNAHQRVTAMKHEAFDPDATSVRLIP